MRALFITLILCLAAWGSQATLALADIVDQVKAVAALNQDDPFETLAPMIHADAEAAEAAGDNPQALELYRIAVTVDRADRVALAHARRIKADLDKEAEIRFEAAKAKFEAGDKDGAKADFLASLQLNPDKPKAVAYLKNGYSPEVIETYTIVEGDTLRRIAEKVYDNPGGELLLTRINNLSIVDTLTPGETLKIPVLDKRLAQRLHAAVAEQNGGKKDSHEAVVVTTQEATASSMPLGGSAPAGGGEALLAMAKLQFGNRLYETAVAMADEVLSSDPGNAKATDIRNESYYALAQQRWDENQAADAMRSLIRLPKGYKDSAALRKKVEAKLTADSEPLYLAGVKYFLNENLEQAVEQWELTLQVNPYHAKARTDLEKARQLLEAVKGL